MNKKTKRPYQLLIEEEIIEKFKIFDNLLSIASMGAGKSYLISLITKYYFENNYSIGILVNIKEILPQIKEELELLNLDYCIIKSGEKYCEKKTNKIWLIMEQSFHKNFREITKIKVDLLIKDEYHIGANQKRFEDIKTFLNPKKILGFTGTPFDSVGYLLPGFKKEQIITHGSPKELTELGFLVPLKYYSVKWAEEQNYSNVKMSNNDYSTLDLDNYINTKDFISLSIKSMNEMNAKKKKTLIYCNSIDQAENFYNHLNKQNYRVAIVHSKKSDKDNKKNLKLFKENNKNSRIDCIVSITKLTTGYNEPQAELLVLARPTKILRLYLQIIFRVARLYKNKKYAEILDLSQCIKTHGFGIEDRQLIVKNEKNLSTKSEIKNLYYKPCIVDMVLEKPKEIKLEKVIIRMKEHKVKILSLKKNTMVNLIRIFNNTMDIRILVFITFELNYRNTKREYLEGEIEDIISFYQTTYQNLKKNKVQNIFEKIKQSLREQIKYKEEIKLENIKKYI